MGKREEEEEAKSAIPVGRWEVALPSCSTLILFFSLVAQKDRDSTHSETPHFGLTFSAKVREVKLENKIEIFNLFLF